MFARFFDKIYRHPFEGRSARRYETLERPAFGDLDQRLLDELLPQLTVAKRLLDVGAGPGDFVCAAALRFAQLEVIGIEPSRDYSWSKTTHPVNSHRIYAFGESLPMSTASVDVAVCLSSLRHLHDRDVGLGELRRVVRPGGTLMIVELDPAATKVRAQRHANGVRSRALGWLFEPLVLRTAPSQQAMIDSAVHAGWTLATAHPDAEQPVYVLTFK